MKTLIKHFIENNSKEVLEKSLFNCHVKGVHSIMLLDSPGKTIRLYIADVEHELNPFLNRVMNVGYHPHHCDLTLKIVIGNLTNITVEETDDIDYDFDIDKYLYKSKISKGEMRFDHVGRTDMKYIYIETLMKGDERYMKADEIHTVSVEKDKICAWLVFEGKEDPNYVPYCYSTTNLNYENGEGLYIKPGSISQIVELLNKTRLI